MSRKYGVLNHVHKYIRFKTDGLWHCVECTSYRPGNMPDTDFMSRCWLCGEEFLLTRELKILDEPVCEECANRPPDWEIRIDYIDYKATTPEPHMSYAEYARRRGVEVPDDVDEPTD